MGLDALDAAALRRWCALSLEALTAARAEIDQLNVYPVPDGDTGTNLMLTVGAAQEAVSAAGPSLADTVKALAVGSHMGARGNSGVIVSQLLRGLRDVPIDNERIGPADLAAALTAGARGAYAAVSAPVEGTLLTVAREAAEAAAAATGDLAAVVRAARQAAADALARTPELLPQLKAAGVVDAGGRGWCVVLDALEQVVTGQAPPAEPALLVPRTAGVATRESGSEDYAYEVQYLLRDATDDAVAELRTRLGELGDSLVVVGTDGLFNVHVHVNDVGAALEAGVDAGRPFRITVTRFEDQFSGTAEATATRTGRAVVAVSNGAGTTALLEDASAHVVDGTHGRPSTRDLLDATLATGALEVVLLPNDSNVRAVATAAAEEARQQGLVVQVVPTSSVLQGLSAVLATNPARAFADDLLAMQSAALRTRWAEVTVAQRDAATDVGQCKAGDVLGLVQGRIEVIGSDLAEVAGQVLDRLLTEPADLVTVLWGDGGDEELGKQVADSAAAAHPQVEVLVLHGGQPHYPLLLGAE
jgi:DAK2 domain fusion protein YloV